MASAPSSGSSKSSIAPMIIAAVLGTAAFSVVTYVVVDQAGGAKVAPYDSNTPNGVTPGAPAYK